MRKLLNKFLKFLGYGLLNLATMGEEDRTKKLEELIEKHHVEIKP